VCSLDNNINGIKLKLQTGGIADVLSKIDKNLGSISCKIFDNIDLSFEFYDIRVGLKKCDSEECSCKDKENKKCNEKCELYHILYLLQDKSIMS